MNHLFGVALLTLGIISCAEAAPSANINAAQKGANNPAATTQMQITIGSRHFSATLEDNSTVAKLKAMLPLTLEMSELNGYEKYFYFSTNLPTNASSPGTIKAGDLMLWQSDSLVLFYESFKTSYSYTKIGRTEDAAGLAAAVGTGKVKVTFALK